MRFGLKKSLTTILITCSVLMAAMSIAVSAMAVTMPPAAALPKADDTARFKMTARGTQQDNTTFTKVPIVDGCSLHTEGTLNEFWEYARGTGVTMEFRKYGHRVFLQRAHRPIGDAAFASKGTIQRDASGFFKIKGPDSCLTFPLPDPICGQRLKAPLDLRLGYSGGKLSLENSGPAASTPSPAEKCGLAPGNGGSANFNHLSYPYPHLGKQKGTLSAKKIFGNSKAFKVMMKDHFLQPLDESGLTTLVEKFAGRTTITFERL
jgi:hypothetical protein